MFCLCHRLRTALFGMPPFQLKTKVDTGQTPPSKRLMILKQSAYAPYYPPREGIMHHNCKSQTFLPFCWFRNARNRRSSGWGWKRQGCHIHTSLPPNYYEESPKKIHKCSYSLIDACRFKSSFTNFLKISLEQKRSHCYVDKFFNRKESP